MHSYHDDRTDVIIHYNGDYSGDATIIRTDGATITIPAMALVRFGALASAEIMIHIVEKVADKTYERLGFDWLPQEDVRDATRKSSTST